MREFCARHADLFASAETLAKAAAYAFCGRAKNSLLYTEALAAMASVATIASDHALLAGDKLQCASTSTIRIAAVLAALRAVQVPLELVARRGGTRRQQSLQLLLEALK